MSGETVTWEENYGILRERLRSYGQWVEDANYQGWVSKGALAEFGTMVNRFAQHNIPALITRCKQLESRIDELEERLEEKERVIAAMREHQREIQSTSRKRIRPFQKS